jgi:uncharacterized protein YqjF (DUF2071 family)
MRPQWLDLLFLHWNFEPQQIQKLLPEGLQLDTFDGRAYIGLVPFTMRDVRPHFVPNIGKLGAFYDTFPELNVRTYVTRNGVPGVWFFSLDAASALAVLTARAWFGLPYFKARMRFWRGRDGVSRYWSKRLWPHPLPATCRVDYVVNRETASADVGSLEEFLIERYVLYSQKNGQFYRGRVWHEPYQLQSGELRFLREDCVSAAGIKKPNETPHFLYSRGVDVEIWDLEKC